MNELVSIYKKLGGRQQFPVERVHALEEEERESLHKSNTAGKEDATSKPK